MSDHSIGSPCGDCIDGGCTMNCSSAERASGSEWIAASIWAGVFPRKASAEQVRDWRQSTMTCQTPDAVREAIIAAITKADANFGYSYRLTKMDDTGEEHTLFMDGFEPAVFPDRDDGYRVIEQRRNAARTDAILAALDSRAGDAGEGRGANAYVLLEPDGEDVRLCLKGAIPSCPCCEGTPSTFSRFFPHSGIYQGYVNCSRCHVQVLANARDRDEARGLAIAAWSKRPATPAPAVDAPGFAPLSHLLKELRFDPAVIEARQDAVDAVSAGEGEWSNMLRQSAAKHAVICAKLANETPVAGEPDPMWWERQSAIREASVILAHFAALSHGEGR